VSTIAQSQDTTIPAGTWGIDPVHSHVEFALDYMVGTFRGSFSPVEATLVVGDDGSVSLTGSVKTEGINVNDENLNAHLQAPDFFDAERAPEVSFRSTDFRRSGNDVTVAGELSIRGTSKAVELKGTIADPITDPYERQRLGLKLEATIDRTAFGIDWNNPMPSGEPALGNDVALSAELFLVKA
jgi:polyisoprenoid-binding protein YceI